LNESSGVEDEPLYENGAEVYCSDLNSNAAGVGCVPYEYEAGAENEPPYANGLGVDCSDLNTNGEGVGWVPNLNGAGVDDRPKDLSPNENAEGCE